MFQRARLSARIIRAAEASSWLDRFGVVFCGFFIILALGRMVREGAFSYFLGIPFSPGIVVAIHNLTVFLVSITFLFFWLKILKETPWFARISLTIAFTLVGYVIYDQTWSVFLVLNLHDIHVGMMVFRSTTDFRGMIQDLMMWVGIPLAILVFFRFWRAKYIPRIPVTRFVLVVGLNFLVILWLYSTDFFNEYAIYQALGNMGIAYPNPHGWTWFAGKTIGMLSWLIVCQKVRVKR